MTAPRSDDRGRAAAEPASHGASRRTSVGVAADLGPRRMSRSALRHGRRRSRQIHHVIAPVIAGTTNSSTFSTPFSVSTSTCRYFASTSLDPASISSTKNAMPAAPMPAADRFLARALGVVVHRRVARRACLDERPQRQHGEDDAGDHDGRQEQLADRVPEQVELPVRPEPKDALEPSGVEVGLGRRGCRVGHERAVEPDRVDLDEPAEPASTAKVMNARPTDFNANFGQTGVPVTVPSAVPSGRNWVCVWCHTSARWAESEPAISAGINRMCITNSRDKSSGAGNSPPKKRYASHVPTSGIESTAE